VARIRRDERSAGGCLFDVGDEVRGVIFDDPTSGADGASALDVIGSVYAGKK
jgi:hypothetical protein